jgi:hypothetical protein
MVRRPFRRRSRFATPQPSRASPNYADYLSGVLDPERRLMVSLIQDKVVFSASLAVDTTPVDRIGARWLSRWRAPAPGRRPHHSFRGLLRLYSRYGPPDCSPTFRGLCREASTCPVTRTCRPPAIESNHQLFEWVLPPLVFSPFGAHAEAPVPHGLRADRKSAPLSPGGFGRCSGSSGQSFRR